MSSASATHWSNEDILQALRSFDAGTNWKNFVPFMESLFPGGPEQWIAQNALRHLYDDSYGGKWH
eukprot:4860302-Prorocentrum_lima.AAC.1